MQISRVFCVMTLFFGEWLSKLRSSLVHVYCRVKQHKKNLLRAPESSQLLTSSYGLASPKTEFLNLIFVDPCIIVNFIEKNPTRWNSIKIYYSIFIWSSTCFGRHTAHHQEAKTALAASGFAYVEGCWTCGCWTLSASSNHTSNNLPRMQNQRLLVQF